MKEKALKNGIFFDFSFFIQLNPGHRTEPPGEKSAENKTDSTKSADAEPHQTTQCGSDPRGEYLCLICKEKFCDGASLANHKNVEHNLVHFCPHCYINFPDQEDLSDHMRTMHKPTLAYMSGPGETVRKVIHRLQSGCHLS